MAQAWWCPHHCSRPASKGWVVSTHWFNIEFRFERNIKKTQNFTHLTIHTPNNIGARMRLLRMMVDDLCKSWQGFSVQPGVIEAVDLQLDFRKDRAEECKVSWWHKLCLQPHLQPEVGVPDKYKCNMTDGRKDGQTQILVWTLTTSCYKWDASGEGRIRGHCSSCGWHCAWTVQGRRVCPKLLWTPPRWDVWKFQGFSHSATV